MSISWDQQLRSDVAIVYAGVVVKYTDRLKCSRGYFREQYSLKSWYPVVVLPYLFLQEYFSFKSFKRLINV